MLRHVISKEMKHREPVFYDTFRTIYYLYGKVVQFRSFQTEHALMCKLHEQDKEPVLKHVLCSLMKTSDFFHTKRYNIVITIKKLENSLQCIENVPTWVQFRSLGGTILISGM
jgi:hypothetical protein